MKRLWLNQAPHSWGFLFIDIYNYWGVILIKWAHDAHSNVINAVMM